MPTYLSRRGLLKAAAATGAVGALAGCSNPIGSSLTGSQPASADVIFWHLFGGGDGANMATMVGDFQKAGGRSVEATLLSWGNPYYTKLSLAASSGRPPDVAVAHLSRLPLLAQAGLLEDVTAIGLPEAGVTEDKFTPAAWSKATVDGTTYAVPLDTHPYVMYYNVPLAEKAGLLESDGRTLKPIKGKDQLLDAMKAMQDAGAEYGAITAVTTDPSTNWRFFMTTYSGLAGEIVSDGGTKLSLDDAAAGDTFEFLQSLTGDLGLMPGNATPVTVSTLFGQGKAGFLFDGVWQIPTYRGVKTPDGEPLDFDVVPFPAILGDEPRSYADSHALVVPKRADRSPERTQDAVAFIKSLLDDSSTWADGGHVPAWLPVQESKEFQEKKPQSGYVQAAFDAVYDPPGWYTGAGSDFQNEMGAVISNVLGGNASPSRAVRDMTASLRNYTTALAPVR